MYRKLLLICWLSFAAVGWAKEAAYVLPAVVRAEYTEILTNKTARAMVFAYQGKNNVTVIDFPSLAEQGRMFNRIVVLLERTDSQHRKVLNDEELGQFIQSIGRTEKTLAFGNNFVVAQLVIFFNYAELNQIQLNTEELALRQHLLNRNLMRSRHKFYQSVVPDAVILSIPQKTAENETPSVTDLARRTILSHEISHGEYSTNPMYREFCRNFWHSVMTEEQRTAFRTFLSNSSYNPKDEELMINETQAYLMYTPDPRAFSPQKVGLSELDIADLRRKFMEGFPDARPPTIF